MSRLLVIMGSGETAPTMVKPHRTVFARTEGDGPAVLLDTPYGFQTNAAELTSRAVRYFADSVGQQVEPVSWRRDPGPGPAQERALAAVRDARWVFAGPGSPTYALRQWAGTPLPAVLAERLTRPGTVLFASAAALTLGSRSVPVYEVYKAGADPYWADGLGLMTAATGLDAVVIPHYDNAEGGTHDTRFCYLGEERLALLERELPDEAFVLGVDEHTACVLDLDARTAQVLGNGLVTVRRHGESRTYPPGAVAPWAELADEDGARTGPTAVVAAPQEEDDTQPAMDKAADVCDAAFRAALAAGDAEAAVAAALELEQALQRWSTDTSDEREYARRVLRSMITELGARAVRGLRDPRELVGPYVDALLELRAAARDRKDWAASDLVRDRLAAAGVEVRDTPQGAEWDISVR